MVAGEPSTDPDTIFDALLTDPRSVLVEGRRMDRFPAVLPRARETSTGLAGPSGKSLTPLVAAYLLICAVVAGCAAQVTPDEAGPFESVTIDGGQACASGETAVATSTAFQSGVTLTRSDDGLTGRAVVADVPPGTYDVEVVCEDGSTARASLEVTDLPGATDTGVAPSRHGGLQWIAGALMVAGLLSLGVGVFRRGRAATER